MHYINVCSKHCYVCIYLKNISLFTWNSQVLFIFIIVLILLYSVVIKMKANKLSLMLTTPFHPIITHNLYSKGSSNKRVPMETVALGDPMEFNSMSSKYSVLLLYLGS